MQGCICTVCSREMVQQGAGVPYVALLIILAFVGEETGSEGGDLAGVQREGPSPESLSSPCPFLCTLPGVGAWHCLRESEAPESRAPWHLGPC